MAEQLEGSTSFCNEGGVCSDCLTKNSADSPAWFPLGARGVNTVGLNSRYEPKREPLSHNILTAEIYCSAHKRVESEAEGRADRRPRRNDVLLKALRTRVEKPDLPLTSRQYLFKSNKMERPDSPSPSHLSMKSDSSMIQPLRFSDRDKGMERPDSPLPSQVSMKSDSSMIQPLRLSQTEKSCQMEGPDWPSLSHASMRSDSSMIQPLRFSQADKRTQMDRPDSPSPSQVSLKSNSSMIQPLRFSETDTSLLSTDIFRCSVCTEVLRDPVSNTCGHNYCKDCITEYWAQSEHGGETCPECRKTSRLQLVAHTNKALAKAIAELKFTEAAAGDARDIKKGVCQYHGRVLDMFCRTDQIHICKSCAIQEHRDHKKHYTMVTPNTLSTLQNMLSSMTADMFRDFQRHLHQEYPECFEGLEDDSDPKGVAERMMESFSREDTLKVTVRFLTPTTPLVICMETVKTKLRIKFKHLYEGNEQLGQQSILEDIYTQLYITEGGTGEVNNEHEVRQIEAAAKNLYTQETPLDLSNIFKAQKHIKTVLTKGIAGIGKTVSVQKFVLDWAEGRSNQDFHLILPLSFRDLNLEGERVYSLMGLLQHYFPELQQIENLESKNIKLLLILDGLDECRVSLEFQNSQKWSDETKPTTLSVLLVNLIQGNLLPSAHLWITSRPAAANQIPKGCAQRVTEVRGFQEKQKEEYFKKKFKEKHVADKIIEHVRSSQSLHIMCHIPVFCWISATVLETFLKSPGSSEIPKDQTQLYTHFLLIQTSMKNIKYQGVKIEDPRKLSETDKEMILKLGRLAFEEIQKGNLIFYEEELEKYGIEISEGSQFSTLCTEIFKEEAGFYSKKIFCFVHLSVQEFLAALYVLCSNINEGANVLSPEPRQKEKVKLSDVLKSAVTKAMRCKNGELDLFLRFLLGLSLDSNQRLLKGLLTQKAGSPQSIKETVKFIEEKIKTQNTTERTINLFHCLNELNDNSLVKEMEMILQKGKLSDKVLKPDQCSALAFVLLISEDIMEEFDLRAFNTQQVGRQRLLPVVKTAKKAILSGCKITPESCETVASALKIANSPVRELELSYNGFGDKGVEQLLTGLTSPHCWLEKLNLAGCGITDTSCKVLATVLETEGSHLTYLDLSFNNLKDSGVKLLQSGLQSLWCNLQKLRLRECGLTKTSCKSLAEVLVSATTKLTDLDLRDNNLKDSGVKLLSRGLGNQYCKLQALSLSGCQITKEGFKSLAGALGSNPSHIRNLDLSYNYPRDIDMKLIPGLAESSLEVKLDHGGESRLKSGLRKYACQLTLDSNTANGHLRLSEDNRQVAVNVQYVSLHGNDPGRMFVPVPVRMSPKLLAVTDFAFKPLRICLS
ncbi:hypothetical protein AOLI_G00314900 [Acnodon oligacanthus]